MKIIESFPPNYNLIVAALGPQPKALFAYNKIIYNPSKRTVTPDLEAHELIHLEQQGEAQDVWYTKYLTNPQFRLEQETEAYGRQYQFAKEHVADKKLLRWALENMAMALSGKEYGSLISFGAAISKIRNYER